MIPILYAALALIISINFLLGLPKIVEVVQGAESSSLSINNKIVKDYQTLGISLQKASVRPNSLNVSPPQITAAAVLVKDIDLNIILYEKDSHKRLPIASTTKIMTSIVASNYFDQNQVLTVFDLSGIEGSSMGITAGEKLTFRSLLYGLMLNSGNDAAYTIAANYPGGVSNFVEAMNLKSAELELQNTHFDNPAGYDSPAHYSSAYDLSTIASLAVTNPQLARVVSTKEASVSSVDRSNIHNLKNVNRLLGFEGMIGIKTGYTPSARENLVGLVDRHNRRILTVVLGSEDRFGETEKLLKWTFQNFQWR